MKSFSRSSLYALAASFAMFSIAAAAKADTTMTLVVEGRGDIIIKLFTDKAPKACEHIVKLAKQGYYNTQRFYRVDRTPRPYLVQFGAPGSRTKSMDDPSLATEGTGAKIPFEDTGVSNDSAGVVGLSNQGDKNSGDGQFYILLAPAKFLDHKYTVFGRVTKGLGVLQSLQKGDVVSTVRIEES